MMPQYAFLDPQSVTQFLLKLLAVGGGFLAGYMVTWLLTNLLDRWTFGGRAPDQLHRAARIIGGMAVAVLVALLVFGAGGEGFGFGGGPGGASSGADDSLKGTGEGDTKEPPPEIKLPDLPKDTTDPVPPEQRVRVTLLGGEDVREEKFYLVNDDRTPVDLAGVIAALRGKKDASARPVGIEVRFAPNNTLPRTHPAVLRLTSWAQANGYPVTFPAK